MRTNGSLLLCLLLGPFSSCWTTVFSSDMIDFDLSYYTLFCHVWLLSHIHLLFSNERQKESGPGGEGTSKTHCMRKETMFN